MCHHFCWIIPWFDLLWTNTALGHYNGHTAVDHAVVTYIYPIDDHAVIYSCTAPGQYNDHTTIGHAVVIYTYPIDDHAAIYTAIPTLRPLPLLPLQLSWLVTDVRKRPTLVFLKAGYVTLVNASATTRCSQCSSATQNK